MPQAYTIRPEDARQAMAQLIRLTDVRHAVVIDAIGLCLAHAGHEPVSNVMLNDWTVVARAAFSAGDQLGRRSGVGACQEICQSHAEGGILMRAITGGMLMVVQHGQRTPLAELRELAAAVAESLPTLVEVKPPPAASSAARDPFAGDGWWSEKAPPKRDTTKPELVQEAEVVGQSGPQTGL